MTFRALGVAFALLISLATPLAVPAASQAAGAPDYVILIDGLCSELPTGADSTATFAGPDGIAARLVEAGWSAAAVVPYSYAGGVVAGDGAWQPYPYGCSESRDQSLKTDVDLLAHQVEQLGAAHPGGRYHLVGFSQGGLVAFGYLARLAAAGWTSPPGTTLASVTTLDSPLGGLPFVDILCSVSPETCGGATSVPKGSSLADMAAIWDTGREHPAGADRSISQRLGLDLSSNESVALTAAWNHGIAILTIGNVRDWLYAPAGAGMGGLTFLDTQWLTTDPGGAGVHARALDAGVAACPNAGAGLANKYGCNHSRVTRDAAVAGAILAVISGQVPAMATSCSAGLGGCLSLPPRPITIIRSGIAAGIVRPGGHFGTSAVTVPKGGRATVLFTTQPPKPYSAVQIWARTRTGAYRFLTSRRADSFGTVWYYAPPATVWTAYQARYAGDYVNGPGVSPGRVVTVR